MRTAAQGVGRQGQARKSTPLTQLCALAVICMPYFVEDASVRPKEFKVGAKDGLMLITLERVKAK